MPAARAREMWGGPSVGASWLRNERLLLRRLVGREIRPEMAGGNDPPLHRGRCIVRTDGRVIAHDYTGLGCGWHWWCFFGFRLQNGGPFDELAFSGKGGIVFGEDIEVDAVGDAYGLRSFPGTGVGFYGIFASDAGEEEAVGVLEIADEVDCAVAGADDAEMEGDVSIFRRDGLKR